jgi:hypothetical protein
MQLHVLYEEALHLSGELVVVGVIRKRSGILNVGAEGGEAIWAAACLDRDLVWN